MQYVSEHKLISAFLFIIFLILAVGEKMDSNIPKTSYAMIDTNGK